MVASPAILQQLWHTDLGSKSLTLVSSRMCVAETPAQGYLMTIPKGARVSLSSNHIRLFIYSQHATGNM